MQMLIQSSTQTRPVLVAHGSYRKTTVICSEVASPPPMRFIQDMLYGSLTSVLPEGNTS